MSICKKCLDFYISDQDPEEYQGLCDKCLEKKQEDEMKKTGEDRL